MALDMNDIREMTIDAFKLRRADDKFTFYYDETNNIRKFYLTVRAPMSRHMRILSLVALFSWRANTS
jgi:hypothetical protein